MIGILNYGSGNIKSLSNALENIEEEYKIVNNKNHFKEISKLIIHTILLLMLVQIRVIYP